MAPLAVAGQQGTAALIYFSIVNYEDSPTTADPDAACAPWLVPRPQHGRFCATGLRRIFRVSLRQGANPATDKSPGRLFL